MTSFLSLIFSLRLCGLKVFINKEAERKDELRV